MIKKEYKGIDLSVIETRVPEDVLIKAEEVMDHGSISGLSSQKGLHWEAVVIDNNLHYTNNLSISKDRLQNCKCNCTVFAKEGICGHVLALIFHLRSNEPPKEAPTGKKRKATSKSKSFNTSNLLTQLTRDELEQFVLTKSRTDRNFKLLLQARFIEKLSQEQIPQFIESTFPILTKANEKIASSKIKTFLDITDELFNHFKILIAQEDLIEGYNLAFLLLKKSFYIKFNLKNDHPRFNKHHSNLLSNYIEVYNLIEAPEYKENINDQLEELLSASYITASLVKEKDLWMLFYDAVEKRAVLSQIIESFLEKDTVNDYNSTYFVKTLQLILVEDYDTRLEMIIKKDLQECYRIIQYLRIYKKYPSCQESMHNFYISKSLNHPLARIIIESITVISKYKKQLITRSIEYFIKYKDIVYLAFIKQISKDWDKAKSKIISIIKSEEDPALLMKFYLEFDDQEAALLVLKKELDWTLLRQFDEEISERDEEACKELYYLTVEAYLINHFGVHAQDFTKTVFRRIESLGYKTWLKDLKLRILQRFPDRKSLFS